MIDWPEYVKLLVALVAIVDIPGSVPLFLQQTGAMSAAKRRIAALTAGLATAAVLFVFAFFGEIVLEAFGITLPAFKLVGGIVILIIALEMLGLWSGGESVADGGGDHPVAVGIFPMAVPLFAGPGSISAVMVYAHEDLNSSHDLILALLIGAVALAITVGLMAAGLLASVIGPLTQVVMNRLLGMIVGALGVEFILEGAGEFFGS